MYRSYPALVDVRGGALFQKTANLCEFLPATRGVVDEIAEFAAIRFGLTRRGCRVLGKLRIALEDQDLMFRPAFLAERVHVG